MSGRELGYYGPSDSDLSAGCFALLLAVVGIPLIVALLVFAFQDEGAGCGAPRAGPAFDSAVSDVPINSGDERAMHAVGLPTRLDVLC